MHEWKDDHHQKLGIIRRGQRHGQVVRCYFNTPVMNKTNLNEYHKFEYIWKNALKENAWV